MDLLSQYPAYFSGIEHEPLFLAVPAFAAGLVIGVAVHPDAGAGRFPRAASTYRELNKTNAVP